MIAIFSSDFLFFPTAFIVKRRRTHSGYYLLQFLRKIFNRYGKRRIIVRLEAGIDENLTVKTDPDGKKTLYYDSDTPLPFLKVSSNGTKALYTFFYWYKTAADVSLMFIDEFDAFYHYELSESVVSILEKMANTQVILTSHNTNLLTNRIMRPDCYFLLTKDKLTSLANATPRDLREGHNLEKLYMSGEFNV